MLSRIIHFQHKISNLAELGLKVKNVRGPDTPEYFKKKYTISVLKIVIFVTVKSMILPLLPSKNMKELINIE